MSTQILTEPGEAEFTAAADVFKILADPTRLRIVWTLLHSEHSVNELADHVGVKPTASPCRVGTGRATPTEG